MLNNSNIKPGNAHIICSNKESIIYTSNIEDLVSKNIEKHLTFTNIMEIFLQHEKMQDYNPSKLTPQVKKCAYYIINKYPAFFDEFEDVFDEVIAEQDKITLKKMHLVILLFKSLYEIVKKYKYTHLLFTLDIIDVCKNIITFAIYILILDDRILLEKQSEFQYNIAKLFNVCIDLSHFRNFISSNSFLFC